MRSSSSSSVATPDQQSGAAVSEPGTPEAGAASSKRSKFEDVARYVADLSRGERAQLRRLTPDPEVIPPAVFWRLADRCGISPRYEEAWLAILPLMNLRGHASGRSLGEALATWGVSEMRVRRWLEMPLEKMRTEARRVFTQVKEPVDWSELGPLLFWGDAWRRKKVARDYFRAESSSINDTTTDTKETTDE